MSDLENEPQGYKRAAIIGAGFGGLSAAAHLAKAGFKVDVYEKSSQPGGRAQVIKAKGFTFDAGPSWYMMPDVFEDFFAEFGHKPSDSYDLKRLDPAYCVVFEDEEIEVESYPKIQKMLEAQGEDINKFEKFYQQTKRDYARVRSSILESPMSKTRDVLNPEVLRFLLSKDMWRSYQRRIRSVFKSAKVQHIFEFMSVFMGGSPAQIPGVYALLAYVDTGLGVYYPQGGFGAVAKAFESVASEQGAKFHYNSPVERINVSNGMASGVVVAGKVKEYDFVLANADYNFVDQKLLPEACRAYSPSKWAKADLSPSALLMFIGLDRKLPGANHHTLFFDTDWDAHFTDMSAGKWAENPLFYVSMPSVSDDSVAPKGCENIFVLVPIPAGSEAGESTIDRVKNSVYSRISKHFGVQIAEHLVVEQIKQIPYFEQKFNSFGGNAFGLSHTLRQSAIFRPPNSSKKIKNLFYAGQYTNPGTGVPMVVLSGKVVAMELQKVARK